MKYRKMITICLTLILGSCLIFTSPINYTIKLEKVDLYTARIVRDVKRPQWLDTHPASSSEEMAEFGELARWMGFSPLLARPDGHIQGVTVAQDKRISHNGIIAGFEYLFSEPEEAVLTVHVSLVFVVHPDYQEQKVGTFLFEELVKIMQGYAEEYDFESFTFQCIEEAVRFWEKMGAEKHRIIHSEDGKTLYIMKYRFSEL